MRTLILYKTKYGATEKYARWLHTEIKNSSVFDLDNFDPKYISQYVNVIIGSCIYNGNLGALKFLIENWPSLKDKNVLFFSVGIINENDISSRKTYETIPQEIRDSIRYMKLPGRITISQLNFIERFIVRLAGAIKNKTQPKEEYIKPLIDRFIH